MGSLRFGDPCLCWPHCSMCHLGMVTAGTRFTGCCEDWMSSVQVELGPGWCGMNWLPIHFSQGAPGRVKEGPERGSNELGGILLGWGWGGGGAGGSITEPGARSTFPLPAPWQPLRPTESPARDVHRPSPRGPAWRGCCAARRPRAVNDVDQYKAVETSVGAWTQRPPLPPATPTSNWLRSPWGGSGVNEESCRRPGAATGPGPGRKLEGGSLWGIMPPLPRKVNKRDSCWLRVSGRRREGALPLGGRGPVEEQYPDAGRRCVSSVKSHWLGVSIWRGG